MARSLVLQVKMSLVRFRPASGLSDLFRFMALPPLTWRLSDLWATSIPGSDVNVLDLEQRISDSGRIGLELGSKELDRLVGGLDQVIDCDLYGYPLSATAHEPDDAPVLVQALDSTEWNVEIEGGFLSLAKAILLALGGEPEKPIEIGCEDGV